MKTLSDFNTYVIIPAFNEAGAVGHVLEAIPKGLAKEVIVVDNNSSDQTAQVAEAHGAVLLREPRQGYGFACLKGLDYLTQKTDRIDWVVFLDADYSDFPEEMPQLLQPLYQDKADLVIGSRALGNAASGSMTPQQIFGNWLACSLMRMFYGIHYTDLGPFRAIRYQSLLALQMQDKTYGWTVEMQLKAARHKLRITEVPVSYRVRIGVSKVSGTLKGTIMAGYKILGWIFKYAFQKG
jgi:glycosyltransferase involved in cell wall biosynthesis